MNLNEIFKEHRAQYTPLHVLNVEFITWKAPTSGLYAIYYVRWAHVLHVHGDCGAAAYVFGESKPLKWMAETDLSYFVSKCQASHVGRDYTIWDVTKAIEVVEKTLSEEQNKLFEERHGPDALATKHEWMIWCSNHGYDVFGDDWYHDTNLTAPGRRLSPQCELHHAGLQRAVAQLKERGCL